MNFVCRATALQFETDVWEAAASSCANMPNIFSAADTKVTYHQRYDRLWFGILTRWDWLVCMSVCPDQPPMNSSAKVPKKYLYISAWSDSDRTQKLTCQEYHDTSLSQTPAVRESTVSQSSKMASGHVLFFYGFCFYFFFSTQRCEMTLGFCDTKVLILSSDSSKCRELQPLRQWWGFK